MLGLVSCCCCCLSSGHECAAAKQLTAAADQGGQALLASRTGTGAAAASSNMQRGCRAQGPPAALTSLASASCCGVAGLGYSQPVGMPVESHVVNVSTWSHELHTGGKQKEGDGLQPWGLRARTLCTAGFDNAVAAHRPPVDRERAQPSSLASVADQPTDHFNPKIE